MDADRDETAALRGDEDTTRRLDLQETRVLDSRRDDTTAPTRERIGHYRLIEEIGRGGQGFVYRAEDLALHREVALKILTQGSFLGAEARLRFEREAEAASRLDHPGVARIYELGEDRGLPYIAMELVHGTTLAAEIARGSTPLSETATARGELASGGGSRRRVAMVASAARALHAAHEVGLVHRDVKPGNIMIRADGEATILDFGLAQDESHADFGLTRSGDLVGTPSYMAPEQLGPDRPRLDRRTDVYALGVCLYELATGERPFAGRTIQELFEAILGTEPRPPRRLNPSVPRDLEAIILTAMDKERDRRYPTALALAEDLRRFVAGEPVQARPVGLLVKSARWVRRNPVVSGAGLAVITALAIAALVFWLKGEEARRERNAKQAALADYDRLADVKRLERALAEAARLFPPSPALVAELESWRARHSSLANRLPGHLAFLEELRREARPRASPDEPFVFADEARQFQHDVLQGLVADLELFVAEGTGTMAAIAHRLEQSQAIGRVTLEEAATRWEACRRRMATNERYAGFVMAPRLGLVPLGPAPDSGLEEFLHWLSHEGPLPERDSAGRIPVTPELGVVFVLVPPGSFLMGSQADDPARSNFDPASEEDERPLQEVRLEAYMLARYEMTQGQWLRSFGVNPSRYPAGLRVLPSLPEIDLRHPVEKVSWDEAMALLPRVDLVLPTEAEWERAARAGGDLRFSGCAEPGELAAYANLRGEEMAVVGIEGFEPGHRDGFVVHAPVGSFRPNAFGFHDMAGNVREWCLDGSGDRYTETPGPRGLRDDPGKSSGRVDRGGSFFHPAAIARIAGRVDSAPDLRSNDLGLRPAMLLR